MQRLSYPTETVLSNKITRKRIVLSFKDSPRKSLGRRPSVGVLVVNWIFLSWDGFKDTPHSEFVLGHEAHGAERGVVLPYLPVEVVRRPDVQLFLVGILRVRYNR